MAVISRQPLLLSAYVVIALASPSPFANRIGVNRAPLQAVAGNLAAH
jgi:hypothetical protein